MLKILYLDNHLIAVDKPAGLLSQADDSGDPDLVALTADYLASGSRSLATSSWGSSTASTARSPGSS